MNILGWLQDVRIETEICNVKDHFHRDPHIDIMHLELNWCDVRIESERNSFMYWVYCDGKLIKENITTDQLDAYISEVSTI